MTTQYIYFPYAGARKTFAIYEVFTGEQKDSQKTTEVLEQKSYTISPYFSSEDAVPFSIQRLKQLSFFHY